MVGGRVVGDGDADERGHDDRHDRPGVSHRPSLRPVLLRPAAGDDHPVADRGAVLHPCPRLHRVRISRAPLRCACPVADQPAVPVRPRRLARRHPGGAVGGALGDPRLDAAGDRPRDLHPDDPLHHDRRRAGSGVDRRQADVRRRRRHVDRGGDRALRHPAARELRAGARARRRHRPVERGRLPVQPLGDLHGLVGHDRRPVPDARLLRLRSEPGAAVPHRQVDKRSASVADDERLRQDPAAAADPVERRAGLPLLPVPDAADAVQPHARRVGGVEPAGRGIRGAPAILRRRARDPPRGCRAHRPGGVSGERHARQTSAPGPPRSSARRAATSATPTSTTSSRPSS